MNEFKSINEFFSQIGCQFQCYDMGRLIRPVPEQTMADFEENRINWASPFMQHAWLAVLFWSPQSSQSRTLDTSQAHYVWFLKLPLDEQAKLNLVARDDFLRRLIEALTSQIENSASNKTAEQLHTIENAMKDNPYGFQPRQEQLANFHAIVHKHLSLPASQYYSAVQHYLAGALGYDNWMELGLQGFADIAARLDEHYDKQSLQVQNTQTRNNQTKSNQELITRAIAQIPASPFHALGNCLENHSVSDKLARAVLDRITSELNENKDILTLASFCAAAIHATAQASSVLQTQLLTIILQSSVASDIELLATISGRCWKQLINPDILPLFLEALANTEHGQGAFNAILSDLMFIPGMRDPILQAFRTPERSEKLAQAIGAFFSQLSQ